jgi:hypothetical protein
LRGGKRSREFVTSRHIAPATNQLPAAVENKNGEIIGCRLNTQLPNRSAVKICDREKIGTRRVLDLSRGVTWLDRIGFRAKPAANDCGNDAAQEARDSILKIDYRDITVMRVTDVLIGNGISDAMRFWLGFSRSYGEESGPTVGQEKSTTLNVCKSEWISASLFEIGGAREGNE